MNHSQPKPEGGRADDSVDHLLAEYLQRVDRGEAVDRERFIAEHPEVADQLRAYFADSDAVRGVADGAARPAPGPPEVAQAAPPESGRPATKATSRSGADTTGYPGEPADSVKPAEPAAGAGATFRLSTTGEPVGVAQVAAFLASSGLMTPEAVDELLSRASGEDDSADAAQLLDELQSSGRLTPFQCQAIREGRMAELILGNYVVLDRLGRGGMGQVFRAWHRKMDRVVALKTLRPETMNSEKAVRRFHREVKTAARLVHPNIVTAYDADESGGVHFLVMEHVAGSDLAGHIRQHGPARVSQAADWIIQAARGLNHAHLYGIIHRDIKPANLLLGNDGTVKVLDMGLARLEERLGGEGAAVDALTQNGDVLGTLDYMAPEQAEDTAQADARADIYSLGCTLFYLLTGRAVYGGHTAVKKLLAHREEPVPSLTVVCQDVPEQVDVLFQRMVAKNPADRPESMAEVIAELEPFATSSGEPTDSTQTYTGPLPGKEPCTAVLQGILRNRSVTVALGSILIAALILFAVMVVLRLPTPAGTLIVEVSEPGATVEVMDPEGTVKVSDATGDSPLMLHVEPGSHQVRVSKDGFEFFAQDVTINRGEKQTIRVTLQPEKIADARSAAVQPESVVDPELQKLLTDWPVVFEDTLMTAACLKNARAVRGPYSAPHCIRVLEGEGLQIIGGFGPAAVWWPCSPGDRCVVSVEFRNSEGASYLFLWLAGLGYGWGHDWGYTLHIDYIGRQMLLQNGRRVLNPIATQVLDIKPGQWYRLDGVRDGGTVKMFIDGTLIGKWLDIDPLEPGVSAFVALGSRGVIDFRHLAIRTPPDFTPATTGLPEGEALDPPPTIAQAPDGEAIFVSDFRRQGTDGWRIFNNPESVPEQTRLTEEGLAFGGDYINCAPRLWRESPIDTNFAVEVVFSYVPDRGACGFVIMLSEGPPQDPLRDQIRGYCLRLDSATCRLFWHEGEPDEHRWYARKDRHTLLGISTKYGPIHNRQYTIRVEKDGRRVRVFSNGRFLLEGTAPDGFQGDVPICIGFGQGYEGSIVESVKAWRLNAQEEATDTDTEPIPE